ncbi:MAG: M20/M25/M40 family metallo-hydrolase [Acidobacteria bacterium]|nr:M20/M25/M40 family metallo-hydrolase [Acidobacteriota bacterium]
MNAPAERQNPAVHESPAWALPLALILFALVLLAVGQRYAPPPAKGENAPAGEFSGGRARALLRDLLGDGSPHPTGSAANARVRDRVVAVLRGLGYAPEVQVGFACNERNVCGRVENVVARLDGREPGPAVMLAAHYDSVAAGPGVADDMMGVAAILEVARILKAGPPPRHTIVLLLDDGEELGMVGARAFVADHPLARQVGAVVNLEGRGSSGPSLMFETSAGNGWLIPLYAAVDRPVTSSLFETLYNRLPNRTDFTVFRKAGMQGLNLAFLAGPTHYHTPLDNLANASPATLQHHGDNALVLIRRLADADLPSQPRGNAVFFDVLSLGLVHWPEAWTPWIAGLAALLLLAVAALLLRRRAVRGGALAWGLAAWLGMLVACAVAGFGLNAVLGMAGASGIQWAAHPFPFQAAFWALALAAVGTVAALFARRAGALGLWLGVWIGWSLAGVLLALTLPGISYFFIVPALAAAVFAGLALAWRGAVWWLLAVLLPAVVAAVLWFPPLTMLYDGMGAMVLAGIALLAGIVFSSLAPLVPSPSRLWRRGMPLAAAAAAVVFTVVAVTSPLHSADAPEILTLSFHQDADTGKARWLAFTSSPLPPALEKAAPFRREREKAYPWSPGANARIAAAPPLDVPGPELTVLADTVTGGERRLRVRLRSLRAAPNAALILPKAARVEAISVQGRPVQRDASLSPEDWSFYYLAAVPPAGLEVDVVLGETAPQTWYLLDISDGLPATGAALSAARPATFTTFGNGNETRIGRQRRI